MIPQQTGQKKIVQINLTQIVSDDMSKWSELEIAAALA